MPAPEGNKNAVGNNGGRPPHFNTPEELENRIEEYFEYIKGEFHFEQFEVQGSDLDEPNVITEKVWDVEPEPPTVTGLALFLGFADRQSLNDYEERIEFSFIIKNARTRVEKGYELRLHSDKPTGAIFALKNMGWKDQSQRELSGPNGSQLGVLTIKKVDGSKPPKDE